MDVDEHLSGCQKLQLTIFLNFGIIAGAGIPPVRLILSKEE
jgi:hypothetical protein